MELKKVVTADGRMLGRVFDLRCRWEPGARAPVVDQVVFGKLGLLERAGLRQFKPRSVHWYLVEAVRGDEVVVAASKR
ncbi:MAG TPA: hypothetical protein VJT80_05300 [Steroidobacteraceae bacterium]|nr:hypothetical protein [Steroidobacteraceae bacterium]